MEKKRVEIHLHDLREYGIGKHRKIDDYPYGGGAGMVLMAPPIVACIEALQQERDYDEIIYMAPDGELLDQPMANRLAEQKHLLILCGHYKGIDERVRSHFITREISIGNYVLSGGELPAAVLVDTIVRLIPGVLSDIASALSDSYQKNLIAPPVYTKPADFRGLKVPDVLLSGHHAKKDAYNKEAAVARTRARRPELLSKNEHVKPASDQS